MNHINYMTRNQMTEGDDELQDDEDAEDTSWA